MARKNLTDLFSKLDYALAIICLLAGCCLMISGNTAWGAFAFGSAGFSSLMGWLKPGKRIQRHLERKMFKKRAHR